MYLASDAQREIDALRAELDARLAALEAALAAHDPRVSLESLVLDLARVVTAEGVATAARGALEGQLGEQERAAAASGAASAAAAAADAARALDAEQQISRSLQGQLEQQRAEHERLHQSMTSERAAAAESARELERARGAQQELVDANSSLRKLKTQLEESVESERQRAADLEARLTRETADAIERRAAAETLEQRCARLKSQHRAAVGAASEAMRERDDLTTALDVLRQEVLAAHASVEARASTVDAERAVLEQSWREAEAARALAERNWKDAEARAIALAAERDELAARLEATARPAQSDLDAARQPAIDARTETARQLESANERIRILELQRFERERAPRDYDVDLISALETKPSPLSDLAGQRARRYTFPPRTRVHLGKEAAVLVDVSVTGAQVICATSPEVGKIVTVTLPSDEAPCFCEGRLLWAQREQSAKNRPFRYRVGLVFTALDEASLRAYIDRHSIG